MAHEVFNVLVKRSSKTFWFVPVRIEHIYLVPIADRRRSDLCPVCVQTLVSLDLLCVLWCWWGFWGWGRGADRAIAHSSTPAGRRIESGITSSSDRCAGGNDYQWDLCVCVCVHWSLCCVTCPA